MEGSEISRGKSEDGLLYVSCGDGISDVLSSWISFCFNLEIERNRLGGLLHG